MAQYEKVFTKPYEDGYENLPSQNTPITAQTLNDKDTAIEHIEDFLDGNEFPTAEDESAWDGAVSDIEWNQSNDFLLENLFTGFTANTSINNTGSETANTEACISNKMSVESYSEYVVTDTKSADRFAHCFNGNSYLGFAFITKDVPFVPNSLKNGCNAIIIQWNKTNEGYILPTDGKMYKNIPSNSELAQITSIGTDESGRTTASQAYAIGEHFYKDGKFCTAKTAIASGATFTLNTNYEEGDISTSLKSAEDTLNNDVLKCIQFGGNENKKFTFSINNARFFVKLYGARGETTAYRAMFRIYLNYTLYNVWKETNDGSLNDFSIAIVNNQLVITVPAYTEWQIEFKPNSGISLVSQSTS